MASLVESVARPIPLEIMERLLTSAARPGATTAGVLASSPVAAERSEQYLAWMERRRFLRRSGPSLEVTREGLMFLADLERAVRHLR